MHTDKHETTRRMCVLYRDRVRNEGKGGGEGGWETDSDITKPNKLVVGCLFVCLLGLSR